MGHGASVPQDRQVHVFVKLRDEYESMAKEDKSDTAMLSRLKETLTSTLDHEASVAAARRRKREQVFASGLNATGHGAQAQARDDSMTDEQAARLGELLSGVTVFKRTEHVSMSDLARMMTRREFAAGTDVIVEGEEGDTFYIIEEGGCDIVVGEGSTVVDSIPAGGSFGELALIYNAPRAATVRASTASVLWEMQRATFRQVQAWASADALQQRRSWLQSVQLLEPLAFKQLSILASALTQRTFAEGDVIIRQGEEGDAFYIVESGEVKAYAKSAEARQETPEPGEAPSVEQQFGAEVNHIQAGGYFGETALLTNQPRNASVLAHGGPVSLLSLGSREFDEILGPLNHLLEKTARVRTLKSVEPSLSEKEAGAAVDQLTEAVFEDGQTVVTEGEDADAVYVLASGTVTCTRAAQPEPFELAPGETCGGGALGENRTNPFTAVSVGQSRFHRLDAAWRGRAPRGAMPPVQRTASRLELLDPETARVRALREKLQGVGLDQLTEVGLLGEGCFGRVTMVTADLPGEDGQQVFALKKMSKKHIVASGQIDHINQEKNMLYEVGDFGFLLTLYRTYQDRDFIYLLTECVQGGELFAVLHYSGMEMTTAKATFYAANVLMALEHMHAHDILYRDLKPENLMVAADGYLRVIDMGFAKRVPYEITLPDGTEEKHTKTYTLCGTPEYLAPEFICNAGHDAAADYWAFGILCYEMLLGQTPFEDASGDVGALFKNIVAVRNGAPVPYPSSFAQQFPDAVDIMNKLLHGHPSRRLGMLFNGADDVKEHPFFKDINWDQLLQHDIEAPYVPTISSPTDLSNFTEDEEPMVSFDDTEFTDDQAPFDTF